MRATAITKRPFTVSEYQRMADTGILREDDRTELIEGEIYRMGMIGTRHASCVDRLAQLLIGTLRQRVIVRVQNPVVIGRYSQPQPDLVVLRPREDFYAARHPGPADILWLIEVSDTSGTFDRLTKLPLYSRFGVQEVWIVDVQRTVVEVHRDPALRGYRTHQTLESDGNVRPLAFPRTRFTVKAILG